MVEYGKTTLSSKFVQLPDMPTNFNRPILKQTIKQEKK